MEAVMGVLWVLPLVFGVWVLIAGLVELWRCGSHEEQERNYPLKEEESKDE